ncbi:hypothetical protein AKJ09_11436 [Labilithrix luteola]|uniref:Tryptophan synthase alpha chain n=1 Tax=Labilithrix luteola TaxID=1391654 RepID=A0A0K1QGC9_9BACT|nr:hypothetical protein [Labilithrix luteola]AKV04773.1 hypothetical protein AKJ09_11436 [Labilithrix luteola]
MKRRIVGLTALVGVVAIISCADSTVGDYTQPPPAQQFVSPDAGGDADASHDPEALSYCPTDKCPTGRTTCPGSNFRCDVDLRNDPMNCGACDRACPKGGSRETYTCVEGRCVLACNHTGVPTLDCDGLPDNGCETDPGDDDNCSTCGDKCDPSHACINRGSFFDVDYGCGCLPGTTACGDFFTPCTDMERDDNHCGACGTACDPTNGGLTPKPHTYFGCIAGECGHPKCEMYWADCDGNMEKNGCETSLLDTDNCGDCGIAGDPGQFCGINEVTGAIQLMCPAGETFCGDCSSGQCIGQCFDLSSDLENCGACGSQCSRNFGAMVGSCNAGICVQTCSNGRADCNGNPEDLCEVNTDSDPRNCGGCGITCDAIAGQACVGGRCMVENCDQDGGEDIPR